MPGLFVFESLWLGLAASFNAAEHTIGTRGWGKKKKIPRQFPIGKRSLSNLDVRQWGTGGQRLGKTGGWILPAPQPVVCDEVPRLRGALSPIPLDVANH